MTVFDALRPSGPPSLQTLHFFLSNDANRVQPYDSHCTLGLTSNVFLYAVVFGP